jgi:putative FmdB family regulatory protein
MMYVFHREGEEVKMPTFEYACKDCGKEFIVFLSIKEYEAKPKITCPHCESDHVERKLSGFSAKTSRKS